MNTKETLTIMHRLYGEIRACGLHHKIPILQKPDAAKLADPAGEIAEVERMLEAVDAIHAITSGGFQHPWLHILTSHHAELAANFPQICRDSLHKARTEATRLAEMAEAARAKVDAMEMGDRALASVRVAEVTTGKGKKVAA